MKSETTINAIIHEVNVAHGIDCNAQARYHIAKQCRIARTEFERKWNELGVWLIDNTEASVADIQTVRAMLNRGESTRGYRTEGTKMYVVYNESHGGYKYVNPYDGCDSYAPIIHIKTLTFESKSEATNWLSDDDDVIVEVPKETSA